MVDDLAKFLSHSSFSPPIFYSITFIPPSLSSLWLLQSAFGYVCLVSTLFDYIYINLVLIDIFLAVSFFKFLFLFSSVSDIMQL